MNRHIRIGQGNMSYRISIFTTVVFFICVIFGCAGPTPGPDKQGAGTLRGAALGAGAGAVYGAQVAAGTGPAALVGAGFGAVAGGISGFAQDQVEENLLFLAEETRAEREVSFAHEVLADHFKRRMELHPTRDIFPADVFFYGDEVALKRSAKPVLRELARLNKDRLAWSRFAITAYIRSNDGDTSYSTFLANERAKAVSNWLVKSGIEPRRIVARAVTVKGPLVIDPHDDPLRYNQAIEFSPLDK